MCLCIVWVFMCIQTPSVVTTDIKIPSKIVTCTQGYFSFRLSTQKKTVKIDFFKFIIVGHHVARFSHANLDQVLLNIVFEIPVMAILLSIILFRVLAAGAAEVENVLLLLIGPNRFKCNIMTVLQLMSFQRTWQPKMPTPPGFSLFL